MVIRAFFELVCRICLVANSILLEKCVLHGHTVEQTALVRTETAKRMQNNSSWHASNSLGNRNDASGRQCRSREALKQFQ